VSGELIELIKEETNIKHVEFIEGEGEMEVILDTTMTPELLGEGKMRELIRSVQVLRKEKGCTIDAHIKLTLPKSEKLPDTMEAVIKKETLADTLIWGDSLDISTST